MSVCVCVFEKERRQKDRQKERKSEEREERSGPAVADEGVLAEQRAERGELLGDALEQQETLAGRALVGPGAVVHLERVGRVEAEHLRLVRQERDVHLLQRLDAPRRRRLGELREELVGTRCARGQQRIGSWRRVGGHSTSTCTRCQTKRATGARTLSEEHMRCPILWRGT